jgi:hypothetical protein
MFQKYKNLFSVFFKHNYFTDGRFTGFKVAPAAESVDLMRRYGLGYKPFADGFMIFYESPFAGTIRNRDTILKENLNLGFRIGLSDLSLYNYTDELPRGNILNRIFFFSNHLGAKNNETQNRLLHHDEFVSGKDSVPLTTIPLADGPAFNQLYFEKPFGHIQIECNNDLPEKLFISFNQRHTYWRYVLANPMWQGPEFKELSIIDKTGLHHFNGPDWVQLPGTNDNAPVMAFTSEKMIASTASSNQSFQLGHKADYDPEQKAFRTPLIIPLPNPGKDHINSIFTNEEIPDSGYNVIKKNISVIII